MGTSSTLSPTPSKAEIPSLSHQTVRLTSFHSGITFTVADQLPNQKALAPFPWPRGGKSASPGGSKRRRRERPVGQEEATRM